MHLQLTVQVPRVLMDLALDNFSIETGGVGFGLTDWGLIASRYQYKMNTTYLLLADSGYKSQGQTFTDAGLLLGI